MAELLLELLSEEIPARMQSGAAERLQSLLGAHLRESGLSFDEVETHAGPRRLIAVVRGLPRQTPPTRTERKGPRVSAPQAAIEGFCKSAGLASIDEAQIVSDKKGDVYLAVTEVPGQPTEELLRSLLPEMLGKFSWPKSMRWGDGKFRWIRPLRRICCVFDGKPVPFGLAGLTDGGLTDRGLTAGNLTEGHRVMGCGPFPVTDFAQYEQTLRDKGFCVVRAEERRQIIEQGARKLCEQEGYELVEDEALLDELAGLVEWPVPLMGKMDRAFLGLPEIIIVQAMRQHQKYLALRNPQAKGALAARFILVANLEAPDGGAEIVKGNERVLSARLSDARFFWEADCQTKLQDRFEKLDGLVFYQPKSGKPITLKHKTEAVIEIAGMLAEYFSPEHTDRSYVKKRVKRAARLSKCDLLTQSVIEFPSLQGKIGTLLAKRQGEADAVADAISEYYRIDGSRDNPVSQYLALADHIVKLSWLFQLEESVTGSADPYGMRRAALGIVRILYHWWGPLPTLWPEKRLLGQEHWNSETEPATLGDLLYESILYLPSPRKAYTQEAALAGAMRFITERFKIWLSTPEVLNAAYSEFPVRRDYIEAAFRQSSSFRRISCKALELEAFFTRAEAECADLVAGYKRTINILNKENIGDAGPPDPNQFIEQKEQALYIAIRDTAKGIDKAYADTGKADSHYTAMQALTKLREPLDAFFDKVMVNVEDEALRSNRLALLAEVRNQMHRVADFSKIQLKARG